MGKAKCYVTGEKKCISLLPALKMFREKFRRFWLHWLFLIHSLNVPNKNRTLYSKHFLLHFSIRNYFIALNSLRFEKIIQTRSMKKLIYKKSRQFVSKSFVSGLNPVTRIWGRVWQISPWTRSKRSLLESERRIICTISRQFFRICRYSF